MQEESLRSLELLISTYEISLFEERNASFGDIFRCTFRSIAYKAIRRLLYRSGLDILGSVSLYLVLLPEANSLVDRKIYENLTFLLSVSSRKIGYWRRILTYIDSAEGRTVNMKNILDVPEMLSQILAKNLWRMIVYFFFFERWGVLSTAFWDRGLTNLKYFDLKREIGTGKNKGRIFDSLVKQIKRKGQKEVFDPTGNGTVYTYISNNDDKVELLLLSLVIWRACST